MKFKHRIIARRTVLNRYTCHTTRGWVRLMAGGEQNVLERKSN